MATCLISPRILGILAATRPALTSAPGRLAIEPRAVSHRPLVTHRLRSRLHQANYLTVLLLHIVTRTWTPRALLFPPPASSTFSVPNHERKGRGHNNQSLDETTGLGLDWNRTGTGLEPTSISPAS